ncbi:MAG: hypothetical protein JWQ79_1942 [Mucilaginibacter sp.]|nr:hypothetical protein [Mucilaginibacter sp.]
MKNFLFKGRFIFIPLAIIAFLSIASFAVMTLWNNLIPDIFHIGAISFGQAMGLFVLCKILFGFGRGGRGWGGRGAPWMRHRMEERFKSMTPEQKEKFKQKMREHGNCGPWGRDERHPFNRNWDDVEKEAIKPVE